MVIPAKVAAYLRAFAGPDTVSLAGAKAFEISGGCTWRHEG